MHRKFIGKGQLKENRLYTGLVTTIFFTNFSDPRTRRLAEQQQKQKSDAVPEKLSFKEKMKMFALESGENNTPKDKLKISRAQRDIDAVH